MFGYLSYGALGGEFDITVLGGASSVKGTAVDDGAADLRVKVSLEDIRDM